MSLLSEHDSGLSSALAGPAFALAFCGCRCSSARLVIADGRTQRPDPAMPQPGDLRLWFPGPRWMTRAFEGRSTIALPLGGWRHLRDGLRRFQRAGDRLRTILEDRVATHAPSNPAQQVLHAWGNLAAGLAAAVAWMRAHPNGSVYRKIFGDGIFSFDCDALPAPLWIKPGALRWGAGEPPGASIAHVEFAHVSVLLDELDHRLDALAALGSGDLRITGRLPLVDRLSAVMNQAGALLKTAEKLKA